MFKKIIRKVFNKLGYEIVPMEAISVDISLGNWIHKLNIGTIIDVGSNEGQFINSINAQLPNKKIFAFEPISSVYQKLVANTKGLNVKAHNLALSDENGTTEINIGKSFDTSSMLDRTDVLKKAYPGSEYIGKETIQTRRLDDVIATSDLVGNTLLKIDVQGYENKVIAGGKKIIDAVAAVIIEFSYEPIYENQWLFDETYRYFTGNGFRFIGMASQVHNKIIGIPLYGDAIFVKETMVHQLYV